MMRLRSAALKAVAALPNGSGKIHTLFNTHWHPEQTGSNEKLGMAGATIIAHENTRLWVQQNVTWPWNGRKFKKLPKIAQPNKALYDKGNLDSGIRYGYISDAAHTDDGDLYVYFSQQNVLAVGDAACGQGWPMVDWWTRGLDCRHCRRTATHPELGEPRSEDRSSNPFRGSDPRRSVHARW
jgi:glyoxylase-like metal-dependent hydrolase (beta-lactamase superfamily II)